MSLFFLALLVLVFFLTRKSSNFFNALFFIGISYVSIIAYGAFVICAGYFLKSRCRGTGNKIALTFDDGPHPEITNRILAVLKEKKVKATFFIVGNKLKKYPDVVSKINREGHEIGNHSWSHTWQLPFYSKEYLKADLVKCSDAITEITGKKTVLFRPPFGVTNPRYAAVVKENRWLSIGWSHRSFDTKKVNKLELINSARKNMKPGAIFLFHDTQSVTAEALPELIDSVLKNGYTFATVSEILNLKNDAQ